MLSFSQKILIIGYGSVSKCTLPLLFKHIDIPFHQVTILDFLDLSEEAQLREWRQKGVNYIQERITAENLHTILSKQVNSGDVILDLAWNIDTPTLLQWCHDHNVLYLNTSVEEWDPFDNIEQKPILEKTLYWRQMKIREMTARWQGKATTAIVDHGANPGLVSHFAKQGLLDIAHKALQDNLIPTDKKKLIEINLDTQNFAQLAMHLGVKVIHCSERDQQVSAHPKKMDEFVNTWSVEGLIEEALAPAELGWGTHEKQLPSSAYLPEYGPQNQIFLPQMGINTWVRSWIPSQEILGLLIRHGEAFGLSDRLTVWADETKTSALYRPTVHYAYMPSNDTLISLHELRANNYRHPQNYRILSDEIVKGEDILGVLIMGHPYQSWWTGSILSIEESRELVPHQNATTTQVAIGVIAGLIWMLQNPVSGFCLPDDLPHEKILTIAKPYLGQFISEASDWTPQKNAKHYFKEKISQNAANNDMCWDFENFYFEP